MNANTIFNQKHMVAYNAIELLDYCYDNKCPNNDSKTMFEYHGFGLNIYFDAVKLDRDLDGELRIYFENILVYSSDSDIYNSGPWEKLLRVLLSESDVAKEENNRIRVRKEHIKMLTDQIEKMTDGNMRTWVQKLPGGVVIKRIYHEQSIEYRAYFKRKLVFRIGYEVDKPVYIEGKWEKVVLDYPNLEKTKAEKAQLKLVNKYIDKFNNYKKN